MTTYIVCETTAAITTHARPLGEDDRPASYTGHRSPQPAALCGVIIAWDTKLPVAAVRCLRCRTHMNGVIFSA